MTRGSQAPGADHVVIVGAGHAGVQLADSLKQLGFQGKVTLVGDEPALPYQRPPLSKDFLSAGDAEPEALPLRGQAFFEASGIEFLAGIRVQSVDRASRTVALSGGSEIPYTHLVFATGARNRTLSLPGSDLDGVFGMRTLDDARHIRSRLTNSTSAIVIGAGFIGLEFAASAVKRGLDVTVVEMAELPMGRVLTARMSEYFAGALGRSGIDVRYGSALAAITGSDGSATGVELASGERLPGDIVIVGIGVIPNDELAAAAGLETDGGIVVNASLQTSDPAVFAIGDCARYPSVHVGAMARLESVQNATDHARHLARVIVGDNVSPYAEVPWFWSQQGDTKLNIVGVGAPDLDVVVRGNISDDRFSIFGYRGDELVCVESLNSPSDHMAARRMLSAGSRPTRAQVSDPAFDLKAFSKL